MSGSLPLRASRIHLPDELPKKLFVAIDDGFPVVVLLCAFDRGLAEAGALFGSHRGNSIRGGSEAVFVFRISKPHSTGHLAVFGW